MDTKRIAGLAIGALVLIWAVGRIASSSSRVDATPSVAASPGDKWRVRDSRSPMDDSKTEVLQVDAEEQIHGPLGATTLPLIVRCRESKSDVYVETGMAASIEEGIDVARPTFTRSAFG